MKDNRLNGLRYFIFIVTLIQLIGCGPTQQFVKYNPNKPISEYDSDLYKCKMMAMQMNPEQRQPTATGSETRCYTLGSQLICNEKPTSDGIYNPFTNWTRNANIDRMASECMSRQGWSERVISNQNYESTNSSSLARHIIQNVGDGAIGSSCNLRQGCTVGLECRGNICQSGNNIPTDASLQYKKLYMEAHIKNLAEAIKNEGDACQSSRECKNSNLICSEYGGNTKRCINRDLIYSGQ